MHSVCLRMAFYPRHDPCSMFAEMVAGYLQEMFEAFNKEMRFLVGHSDQSTILLMLNEGFYAIADRRLNTSLICRGVKFVNFV